MDHSFDVDLAKRYGMLEAVLLNHFKFWIRKNEANGVNFHDGHYWTYNSTRAFQELFPYASKRQIEKALKHLRDENVLIVGNYNENKYDRTLWYALSDLVESISPNGEMEATYKGNGNPQQVTPIPDIDPDKNPDVNTSTVEIGEADFQFFRDTYNRNCPKLAACTTITQKRRQAIAGFLRELPKERWIEVCEKASKLTFLHGQNKSGWRADFNWLIQPEKAVGVLEGVYDDRQMERTRHAMQDRPEDIQGDMEELRRILDQMKEEERE